MDVRRESNIEEIVKYTNKNDVSADFLRVLLRRMWNEAVEIGMNREYESQKSRRTPKTDYRDV